MLAVLFDLDGTLLETNFDTLMEAYLQRLGKFFSPWMEPDRFINHLLAATKEMIMNPDPERFNLQVFADFFFAETKLDPKLWKVFDQFYTEEFPQLAYLASAHPDAVKAIQTAFDLGHKVVIATNPVFPDAAIRERLKWAGVDQYPYALVTTGDNMHYCKPHVQYYEEIAQRIGVDPQDCIMVGDDPYHDGPAAQCGMQTYIFQEGKDLSSFIDFMLKGA